MKKRLVSVIGATLLAGAMVMGGAAAVSAQTPEAGSGSPNGASGYGSGPAA
jgi:hypothetical protein